MSSWVPARTESIRAFYMARRIFIVASGRKPTPCHEVDVERLSIFIHPAQYGVRWRQEGPCIEVETAYRVMESFPSPENPGTITVHNADGPQDVPVEEREWDPHPGLGPDPAGPAGVAALAGGEAGGRGAADDTATGYSAAWDFGEALQDAIDSLPEAPPSGIADELFDFRVVASGAVIGGFPGFHHLYVTVRRLR
ncbi:MAG TPA: hypothetical protein VF615_29340 [Longimicrobiaceae bacterium]